MRTSSSLSSERCQSAGSHVTFAGRPAGRACRVKILTGAPMSFAARTSVSQSRWPSFPIARTSFRPGSSPGAGGQLVFSFTTQPIFQRSRGVSCRDQSILPVSWSKATTASE